MLTLRNNAHLGSVGLSGRVDPCRPDALLIDLGCCDLVDLTAILARNIGMNVFVWAVLAAVLVGARHRDGTKQWWW